jgi:adhesin transport system outer membrane protein
MHKKISTIAGTVVTAALMLASAAATAQTYSFAEVARQAVATHPAIRAKLSSSAAARADSEGAVWQRYPTPSFEFDNDNNNTRSRLLRVQQPLWAGGRIDAGIDAANSRHQAADIAIEETKQEIMLRVISAYVEAQRQQAREETLVQGVLEHERLLGMISRRVEHDASPRVDQDLAQSRLYQAMNDLSSVKQALANALTQLSQLSGMTVRGVRALDVESLAALQGKDALLEQTIAWSPTLRRLSFEEEATQADVELKRASYKPQVSVRYENSYASAPLNGVPAYTTNRVLLVLEAQTGAGLSALSGVDAAIGRRDAARQQRETSLRDVRERFAMDWDEFMAARLRLENATLASKMAKEVFESYTRQYTAGRKTWLDVMNTVRESTQSDVAVTDAGTQAAAASLRLQLTSGNLKELPQ